MKNGHGGHRLEKSLADTQRVFEELVHHSHLSQLLSAFSDWAVVGGAVRDVLLTDEEDRHSAKPLWQDLDIAIAHESHNALVDAFACDSSRWHVQPNSFGGVKATLPKLGSIDLWVTGRRAPRVDHEKHQYWERYLDTVDFGVNAVAFAWPNCDLIVHQRWIVDMRSRCVEVLSHDSPRKEIQLLRAIALCAALTCRFREPAHLGKVIWSEIDELAESPENMALALTYLRSKVASGRWSKDHLLPFIRVLIDKPCHKTTRKEFKFLDQVCTVIKQTHIAKTFKQKTQ